jgi:uncharacterized membrane protein YdbT with pleckstrin-like domain
MFAPREPDEYLLPTERRVIRVRRHWAFVAWDIFEAMALLAVAVMVSYLLPVGSAVVQNVLWYGALLVLLRFGYVVAEWWVERIVVTDKRFMLVSGVFTTRVSMIPIGKVTDLTYERPASGRLFGYGTLIVESAGKLEGLNRIEYLPSPQAVYDGISDLVFGDKKAQSERFSMIKAQRAAKGKKLVP